MAKTTSMARGTALGAASQVWHLLTVFVLYHYLSAEFGGADFGKWRVTLSVLNYAEMILIAGIGQVVAKQVAENPDSEPLTERAGYLAQMVLAFLLLLVLEAGAGFIADALGAPHLEALIRIAALDIPLVAAFMLASSLQLGRHRFARQVAGMASYATAKFALVGGLVWFGYSIPGALVGNALASIVGFVVLFSPLKKAVAGVRAVVVEARAVGRRAVPFIAQNLVLGVTAEVDLWFVSALVGGAMVGYYGGAVALAAITSFLFAALSRVLFPSVARAGAEGDVALVSRYTTQAVRLALLVTVLGVGVIAATGQEALVLVYQVAFAAAALPFTVLMVAAIGHNVFATCADVLMARGRLRQTLTVALVATVSEVVLLVVLVPRFGPLGAAAASAAVGLAASAAGGWMLREFLSKRVWGTLVRSVVAAGLVWAGLALMHPTGFMLIPAYLAAGVVYVAGLFLLGEVDSEDRVSLRRLTSRTG